MSPAPQPTPSDDQQQGHNRLDRLKKWRSKDFFPVLSWAIASLWVVLSLLKMDQEAMRSALDSIVGFAISPSGILLGVLVTGVSLWWLSKNRDAQSHDLPAKPSDLADTVTARKGWLLDTLGHEQDFHDANPFVLATNRFRHLVYLLLLLFLGPLSIALAVSIVLTQYRNSLGPGVITITKEGAISLKVGSETSSVFLLSANGNGNKSPWVDTGVRVKEGQQVRINASGKVCIAVHHIIEDAKDDSIARHPWVGPEGLDQHIYPARKTIENIYQKPFLIAPYRPYGMLIGYISESDPELNFANSNARCIDDKIIKIGSGIEFKAKQPGTLWLTINEIWLVEETKRAYLILNKQGDKLDEKRIKEVRKDELMEKWKNHDVVELDVDTAPAKKQRVDLQQRFPSPKEFEQSQYFLKELQREVDTQRIRKSRWNSVISNGYPNLWYDDNAGSFSVTIQVE